LRPSASGAATVVMELTPIMFLMFVPIAPGSVTVASQATKIDAVAWLSASESTGLTGTYSGFRLLVNFTAASTSQMNPT
jgi:hypothetical protein